MKKFYFPLDFRIDPTLLERRAIAMGLEVEPGSTTLNGDELQIVMADKLEVDQYIAIEKLINSQKPLELTKREQTSDTPDDKDDKVLSAIADVLTVGSAVIGDNSTGKTVKTIGKILDLL